MEWYVKYESQGDKKLKNRKVGIIGSICDDLDGQTIKTKILYSELKNATNWKLCVANTQYKATNTIKLLFQTITMLFTCKDIFILVSQNGARFYFPLLYWSTKILKTRVYHDVIGGSPADYIRENYNNKKYLNSFIVNWVETKQMCVELREFGVMNAKPLPNFKRLNCIKEENAIMNFDFPLPLCTFSRVMKEKGIEDAINAINKINSMQKKNVYKLDIYGSVDCDYKDRFEKIMSQQNDAISYCGLIPYNKSVEVVKNYYALLFPTYWFGEGFPGTIIDAFSSGVPVIATDFSANSEIISDMKTGIIYPNENIKTLEDALMWMIDNKEKILIMRKNCVIEAEKYQPDIHVKTIVNIVERN